MNNYTLVSFVGTGMYKKEGGYRTTIYKYPDGIETEPTKFFVQSILEAKYKPISRVILIGTYTSSWDALLDEKDPAIEDLWLSIKTQCEENKTGISEENIKKLESYFCDKYKVPCTIYIHTNKIDANTINETAELYSKIAKEISLETNLLLDITHGFRSMPVLFYQSLQLATAGKDPRRIDLIYGEYIDDEKISYVRDLSDYWNYSEIAFAVNLFKNKLDGRMLAQKLEPVWESGAKVVSRFSDIVECNYSLQLPEVFRQMKNALEKRPEETKNISWVNEVADYLSDIYTRLNNDKVSETLRNYSRELENHGLVTQAVIALQVAIEAAVAEKFGPADAIGNYDWYQEEGKQFFADVVAKLEYHKKQNIYQIEWLRNQIAHGGARDKKTGEYPSVVNISRVFTNGKSAALSFFKELEKSE